MKYPKHRIVRWRDWEELCGEWGIDPYENVDYGKDKGGGDSEDFEFVGDIPEKEESELRGKCCGNCDFGAGRFFGCPIQNCMNTNTIHLIVPRDFICDEYKPPEVEEKEDSVK